jgi:hypothetical protein
VSAGCPISGSEFLPSHLVLSGGDITTAENWATHDGQTGYNPGIPWYAGVATRSTATRVFTLRSSSYPEIHEDTSVELELSAQARSPSGSCAPAATSRCGPPSTAGPTTARSCPTTSPASTEPASPARSRCCRSGRRALGAPPGPPALGRSPPSWARPAGCLPRPASLDTACPTGTRAG